MLVEGKGPARQCNTTLQLSCAKELIILALCSGHEVCVLKDYSQNIRGFWSPHLQRPMNHLKNNRLGNPFAPRLVLSEVPLWLLRESGDLRERARFTSCTPEAQ